LRKQTGNPLFLIEKKISYVLYKTIAAPQKPLYTSLQRLTGARRIDGTDSVAYQTQRTS
jgi:hypothetical protein